MGLKSGPGSASIGALADVHDTQQNELGFRVQDRNGNEYIYLLGVASTVQYDAVFFGLSTYATTRLVVDKAGPVAVAQAAIVANKYGWYQIFGFGSVNSDTVAGANLPLYVDGTAGRVDDAGSAGDWISGMASMAADTANVLPVWMAYPFLYHSGYLT